MSDLFTFGPYELDARARRLRKHGEAVTLGPRPFAVLATLVARAGAIVSKDELIAAAWGDVAVTDNSLEQAISTLRRLLGRDTSATYIETDARLGYHFAAPVTRVARREDDEALEALLAPHRAFVEGRAALESLAFDQLARARQVFSDMVTTAPNDAPAHVGLANACALQFESTRALAQPDVAALKVAAEHAREACRLAPESGEAWATLGFVLERTGRHADAIAAGRRAVALESDNWRHHLRLSYASWGEDRLRAARRTLSLMPDLPFARWLAATVLVARGNFIDAARELDAGIAAQEAEAAARFGAVALHWLRGLIHCAEGREALAMAHWERELEGEQRGHLYGRECGANTWYAIGSLHFWAGRRDTAARAFDQALDRVAIHPLARAGLAALGEHRPVSDGRTMSLSFEATLAEAAAIVLAGPSDRAAGDTEADERAAGAVEAALATATSPSAGWILPVEPLLRVWTKADVWSPALARLRARAV